MKQSLDKLFDQYEDHMIRQVNSPEALLDYEETLRRTKIKREKERLNTPLCDGSSDDDESIFGE